MADPETVLDALVAALRADDRLPEQVSYLTEEWDRSSSGARVGPPVISVRETDLRETTTGSTVVEHVRASEYDGVADDSQGIIGEIREYTWEMAVQCDVYVVARSDFDATELGTTLRTALRPYEPRDTRRPLLDANGDPLPTIDGPTIGDGQRRDDLTTTGTLRRYIQNLTVTFADRENTVDTEGPTPYIKRVDAPRPGEPRDGTGDDPAVVSRPSDSGRQ